MKYFFLNLFVSNLVQFEIRSNGNIYIFEIQIRAHTKKNKTAIFLIKF